MVTPSKRGKGRKTKTANDKQDQTPAERHAAMTWAQRLKRVFDIDIALERLLLVILAANAAVMSRSLPASKIL